MLNITNVQLVGTIRFMDRDIPNILGGFGEQKKSIINKTIEYIHTKDLKEINRLINNNRSRFIDGIDIIDLKNGDYKSLLLELGFSNRDIIISNNIYLLSERGYAKLIKIMDDEKSWEIHDKLIDEYFSMREDIKKYQNLSPMMQILINLEFEQTRQKEQLSLMSDRVDIQEALLDGVTQARIGDMAPRLIADKLKVKHYETNKAHGMFTDALAKEIGIYVDPNLNLKYKNELVTVVIVTKANQKVVELWYTELAFEKMKAEITKNKLHMTVERWKRGERKGTFNYCEIHFKGQKK